MGQAGGEVGGRPGLRGPPLTGPLLARCPVPPTSVREGQGSASALAPSPGREGSGPQPTAWEGAVLPPALQGPAFTPLPRGGQRAPSALGRAAGQSHEDGTGPRPGGVCIRPSRRGPRGHLALVQGWGQAWAERDCPRP